MLKVELCRTWHVELELLAHFTVTVTYRDWLRISERECSSSETHLYCQELTTRQRDYVPRFVSSPGYSGTKKFVRLIRHRGGCSSENSPYCPALNPRHYDWTLGQGRGQGQGGACALLNPNPNSQDVDKDYYNEEDKEVALANDDSSLNID